MGKIDIVEVPGFTTSKNTKYESSIVSTEEDVDKRIRNIVSILRDVCEDKCCYIFGMGAQPKSVYKEVDKTHGVELVWHDSLLPKMLKVLSSLIASHAGLVKVVEVEALESTFKEIVSSSMAGIYVFNKDLECEFVNDVRTGLLPSFFDSKLKVDKEYFIYIVDMDNFESSTGIYEIISYGVESKISPF